MPASRTNTEPTPRRATHLTGEQLERLVAALRAELAEQQAELAEHADDLADSEEDRDLAIAMTARAQEAIAELQHALDRVEEGSYGICESCGVELPFERLEILPHATRCVTCQSRPPGLVR